MEIGNSFNDEKEYDYDEEYEKEDENKIPKDKFGWFYKVFTIYDQYFKSFYSLL